ncbi:MAG: epoxide hydrolase N-terminal domain-containing protein [Desulfobacteraceae bacterium]|jgi:hypothetical protein|nr:epoxide hydrolase N-terminal domain-containing protein [Desulfobacteraceae bacterium]
MAMQPFRIKYTEREIDDLHRRLDATRWPTMPFDTVWSSGANDRVLRDLVQYWLHEYDWPEIQEQLNRLTHFRGPIGEEELHCVLYKGSGGEQHPPLRASTMKHSSTCPRISEPAALMCLPGMPNFQLSRGLRLARWWSAVTTLCITANRLRVDILPRWSNPSYGPGT